MYESDYKRFNVGKLVNHRNMVIFMTMINCKSLILFNILQLYGFCQDVATFCLPNIIMVNNVNAYIMTL